MVEYLRHVQMSVHPAAVTFRMTILPRMQEAVAHEALSLCDTGWNFIESKRIPIKSNSAIVVGTRVQYDFEVSRHFAHTHTKIELKSGSYSDRNREQSKQTSNEERGIGRCQIVPK